MVRGVGFQTRLGWIWASRSPPVYLPLLKDLTQTSQIRENRETVAPEPTCFHMLILAPALHFPEAARVSPGFQFTEAVNRSSSA